jgi:mannose-6-phosphate isomerase-like protein (cupin superfamily)
MASTASSNDPTGVKDELDETGQATKRRVTVDEALAHLAGPESKTFATAFSHGSLQVDIYSPQKVDPQQPHSRDEVYVVVQGSGEYISAAGRQPFEQGDFLFAPAGEVHRFENFSDDAVFWVLFYGPEGGEAALKPKP